MRIGIVTWYGVTNYGSALQAYALQHLIAEFGEESVILRHSVHEPKSVPAQSRKPAQILRRLRGATPGARAAARGERGKAAAVAAFRDEYLTISQEYLDEVELDLAIIGSDQIFDIRNLREFQFGVGLAASRVGTYAPSFGETTLGDVEASERYEFVRGALNSIDDLSARDENSREILQALTGREINVVIDPTLVYDFAREEALWDVEPPCARYVAIYSWGGATVRREFADGVRTFAQRHALKTVSIGDTRAWCDYNLAAASPQEFFSVISKATVVITNMFHGSCFAFRAGVPLIPIVMPHNAEKLGDLLKRVGLGAHRVDDVRQIASATMPEIDYATAHQHLLKAKATSFAHLDAVLGRRGGDGFNGTSAMPNRSDHA